MHQRRVVAGLVDARILPVHVDPVQLEAVHQVHGVLHEQARTAGVGRDGTEGIRLAVVVAAEGPQHFHPVGVGRRNELPQLRGVGDRLVLALPVDLQERVIDVREGAILHVRRLPGPRGEVPDDAEPGPHGVLIPHNRDGCKGAATRECRQEAGEKKQCGVPDVRSCVHLAVDDRPRYSVAFMSDRTVHARAGAVQDRGCRLVHEHPRRPLEENPPEGQASRYRPVSHRCHRICSICVRQAWNTVAAILHASRKKAPLNCLTRSPSARRNRHPCVLKARSAGFAVG